MTTMTVGPRQTPAERDSERIEVRVDERLSRFAELMEDWAGPRQEWTLELREGHEFGRDNNVETELLYADGAQTSSLVFRLDQLEAVEDTGQELVLRLDERDGIAMLARLSARGLDVELFHILTFT
jgi:hypothetical protein